MQHWKPIYSKILLLTAKGESVGYISRSIGMSAAQVSNIRGTEEFKSRLSEVEEKTKIKILNKASDDSLKDFARARLENSAYVAANTVVKFASKRLTSADDLPRCKLQLEAARDILDRVGLKGADIIETRTRDYSPQEVEGMRNTLAEMEIMMSRFGVQESRFLLKREDSDLSTEISLLSPDKDSNEKQNLEA